MSLFSKPKSKKEQTEEQRRRRRGEGPSPATRWFNAWQVVAVLLFLSMSGLVTLVCFVGISPALRPLAVNDRARVPVVADVSFTYTSTLQTDRERKKRQRPGRSLLPPGRVRRRAPAPGSGRVGDGLGRLCHLGRPVLGRADGRARKKSPATSARNRASCSIPATSSASRKTPPPPSAPRRLTKG